MSPSRGFKSRLLRQCLLQQNLLPPLFRVVEEAFCRPVARLAIRRDDPPGLAGLSTNLLGGKIAKVFCMQGDPIAA